MSIRLETIPTLDGRRRTDRQTELINQYGAVHPLERCGAVNLCRIFVETTGSYNGPAIEDTGYSTLRILKEITFNVHRVVISVASFVIGGVCCT